MNDVHPGGTDVQPRTIGSVADIARGQRFSSRMPALRFMELILTARCNLRCSYCWEEGKQPVDMSVDTAKAAVDFLMDASRSQSNITILFFGGEPLLRFNLIQIVWEYATSRARSLGKTISWDMTTNGTLASEDVLRWCARHKLKYLLSMDGGRAVHDLHRKFPNGAGSYERIARNIPLMKRYQPWLGVRMSITPQACLSLKDGIRELHELGINQFLLGYTHGVDWTSDDLRTYERSLKEACELYLEMKYRRRHFRMTMFEAGDIGQLKSEAGFGCGAGRGRFAVDPHGDIYGCSKLATIAGTGHGILPLGNVFQGFTRIDNRRVLLDNSLKHRGRCRSCDRRAGCSGGCPALNAAGSGDPFIPADITCQLYHIDQRVDEYMKRRYREVFGKDIEADGDRRSSAPAAPRAQSGQVTDRKGIYHAAKADTDTPAPQRSAPDQQT